MGYVDILFKIIRKRCCHHEILLVIKPFDWVYLVQRFFHEMEIILIC